MRVVSKAVEAALLAETSDGDGVVVQLAKAMANLRLPDEGFALRPFAPRAGAAPPRNEATAPSTRSAPEPPSQRNPRAPTAAARETSLPTT